MAGLPHDMFGTLKAPLHSLRGTAGMTGLPHDAFDTLKAPLRGPRGTAAHLAYEEPTGLFASRLSSQAYGLTHHTEAPASLHSRHVRYTQGTAARPSRLSSQAYGLTCHMEAPVPLLVRICVAKYGWHMEPATPRNHPAWRNTDDVHKQQRTRAIGVAQCGGRAEIATQGTGSA